MTWFLEPVPVTSGLDWLVALLRMAVADPAVSVNNVVMEENSVLSSGDIDEVFYTNWLPIASGYDTYMRIGRWYYEVKDSAAEASGLRAYVFGQASGSFWVPSGAICGISGEKVYLSYSWLEEQTYTYTDLELKLYLRDAITEINGGYYDFGHIISGISISYDIYPSPGLNDVSSYIYVKYATYLIKKQQESEGFDNRIYVRDLNVTIDTAKGLGDLSKSADNILSEVKDIIQTLTIKGQEAAFAIIDTYSTYVAFGASDNYAHRYINNTEEFFGQ